MSNNYIQINGLQGPFENWFSINEFNFDVIQPSRSQVGEDSVYGETEISDLTFTKPADSASTFLLGRACTGTPIEWVEFKVTKNAEGDNKTDYYVVRLEAVVVAGCDTQCVRDEFTNAKGKSTHSQSVREQITLAFRRIAVKYTKQKAGMLGDSLIFGWDLAAKKSWVPSGW